MSGSGGTLLLTVLLLLMTTYSPGCVVSTARTEHKMSLVTWQLVPAALLWYEENNKSGDN